MSARYAQKNKTFHFFVSFQNISCREIGSTEDSTPLVQLYISAMNEDKGELETRFVNKELVEQGYAQWVEHGVLA